MAIDIQSVSFSYPDGTAPIEDVSFNVPTGKVTALVGPKGVGRTTPLELVSGNLDSDEGTIRTDTEVAYMRQNPGFDDEETGTALDALSLSLLHSAAFTRVFNRFIIFDRDGIVAETETVRWLSGLRAAGGSHCWQSKS